MNMWPAFVSALLLASGVLPPAHGGEAPSTPRAPPQTELRLRLGRNAAQWLKENDVPSVAVAYIEDGKVAWTAVYGEQSPGVPATATTLYNIASLTKPISAEVILRLASAGQLSLDEPVSAFWIDPDVKENPWNKLLTPRLCLSLTKEIVAQRLASTRNQILPDERTTLCAHAKAESTCSSLTSGMALGWQVVQHNDETIVNHDGSDWGVRTLAFFLPHPKRGAVILTNGENGTKVIREIVGLLYADPVFIATLD